MNETNLFDFVEELQKDLFDFREWWQKEHQKAPENFPIIFPKKNSNLWLEQFMFFIENRKDNK